MSVKFFGAIDRTREGKISSEYPAWTFPRQIENAREQIILKTNALKSGSVDRQSEGEYRILIEREKARLDAIEESRPKLNDAQRDICYKAYKDLTNGIQETMATYSDIHRNYVDAHDEHRINSQPCIKINGKTAELAEMNGIKISSSGKISRKNASRLAKFIGHAIGENTNMERLRKEGYSDRQRHTR